MTTDLKHFTVYYLNFDKVFEIAMLLNNEIPTSKEEDTNKQHTTNITARIGTMLKTIFEVGGEGSYEYSKASGLRKTVEIKSTNAVILRDVIEEVKLKTKTEEFEEGQLIIVRDLNLSIENEDEMRQMKLIKQGILDRFTHENIPIGEMLKSLVADYAYILTAKSEENSYLIKIPSGVENEFENNYTIDDLLMGRVTLIGIYKGERKMDDLKSTFSYLKESGNASDDNQIKLSNTEIKSDGIHDDDDSSYHFIDTLAIIQELKLGD